MAPYLLAVIIVLSFARSGPPFSVDVTSLVVIVLGPDAPGYGLHVLQEAMTCMGLSGSPLSYCHSRDARHAECERVARQIAKLILGVRRPYCWLGACGPWLEDIWGSLANGPFDDFGPFVPVFVPWMKMFAFRRHRYRKTAFSIFAALAADFLYVTVSGNADGLEGENMPNGTVPKNLFVLSQGGKGHVPMLMWLRELRSDQFHIPANYDYDVVFLGTIRGPVRARMKDAVETALPRTSFVGFASNWIEYYRRSKFILAPRGWGRNSYRLTEVLQMGMVPVYVYNDICWLPFYDSLNWSSFAVIARIDQLPEKLAEIGKTSPATVEKMRRRAIALRHSHFSAEATVLHMKTLLRHGFSGSDLRCARYSGNR